MRPTDAARRLYRSLFNREYLRRVKRMRALYRTMFTPGDLVFDVGAHRGDYAALFTDLGARVVAVEANPRLAEELRRRVPAALVESVALGGAPGEATLHLGHDSEHSTLSEAWTETMPDRWAEDVTVKVDTLDALLDRHGVPAFCKIDVEGYEDEVLRGLGRPLPALSFEFQCAAPDVADAATARLAELGPYVFSVVVVDRYELDDWVADRGDVAAAIGRIAADYPTAYGDVYARLRG
jgi:FkbM family methyltransferase